MNSNRVVLIYPTQSILERFIPLAQKYDDFLFIIDKTNRLNYKHTILCDFENSFEESVAKCKDVLGPKAAFFALNEFFLPLVNKLNYHFQSQDLTHFSPLRSKTEMKKEFLKSSLNTSKTLHTVSMGESVPKNLALQYPVIIKPVAAMASAGVKLVHSIDQLLDQARKISLLNLTLPKEDSQGSILIEEFIDGNEYAVDTLWQNGKPIFHGILARNNCNGPYFPDRLYYQDPHLPKELTVMLRETAEGAARAINVMTGASHTEIKIRDGIPYIIETTNRPGAAGLFLELFGSAYGYDLVDTYYQLVSGKSCKFEFNLPRECTHGFLLNFPMGSKRGVIAKIEGVDALKARPEVFKLILEKGVGDRIEAEEISLSYFAYLLANTLDDTVGGLDRQVNEYLNMFKFEIR